MSTTLAEPGTGATLDLVLRPAGEFAHTVGAEHVLFNLHEPDPRYELLDEARTLLM